MNLAVSLALEVIARRANHLAWCAARVQPRSQKYLAWPFARRSFTDSSRPAPNKGAYRDRHERWVRDAVDAGGARDECADPPSLKLRRDWYQALRAAFVETAADGEVVWA